MPDIIKFQDVFFYLFIPGFSIYKIVTSFLPIKSINITSKSAIEIITYGVLNFYIYIIIKKFLEIPDIIFFVFSPLILSAIIVFIFKSKWFRKNIYDIAPTPWDFFFIDEKEESLFVIIVFKDNKMVGGLYGEKSRSSKYPRDKEIFLEKEWVVNEEDEKLEYEIIDSKGVWINCNEIKTIKFY